MKEYFVFTRDKDLYGYLENNPRGCEGSFEAPEGPSRLLLDNVVSMANKNYISFGGVPKIYITSESKLVMGVRLKEIVHFELEDFEVGFTL